MRPAARTSLVVLGMMLAAPVACKKTPSPGPAPNTTSSGLNPAPPPSAPATEQAPIRVNETLGEMKSGAALRVRMFVSTLTSQDPIHFGLQLVPEKPLDRTHPWYAEQIDWSQAVASLVFELESPKGKVQKLQLARGFAHPSLIALADVTEDLALDGSGLTQYTEHAAWSEPKTDLLPELGKYSLTIRGSIKTDKRTLELASKPIELEVVARDREHGSLAEIEAAALSIVRAKAKPSGSPTIYSPTIDDINGNLWTRFDATGPVRAYDIDIVEVLVSPAGKEIAYDAYKHFTCVALGSAIATPTGDVPVERLAVGDQVVSYDPATRRFGTSRVEQISSTRADELYAFGRLRVTGNHPIFADGRWQRAGDIEPGARLFDVHSKRVRSEPLLVNQQTVVYDLSVTPPHTYFADGLLVHNKAVFVPIGGNQPWRGWFFRRAAKAH